MLATFAVKNFRGFKDRIELDLTRHNNYNFSTYAIKNDIIKNGIIYGPNGAGKTNFGLAIFDIVNHLSQKWKKADYYANFTYGSDPALEVEFEYTFIFDGKPLIYRYKKDYHGILRSEELIYKKKIVFKREKGGFEMFDKAFPMDKTIKNNLADNANNVSIVNFLTTSYPLAADHYLLQLHQFVNGMLWYKCLDAREFIGLETGIYLLDEYIIKNNLVKDFQKFLLEVSEQEFHFVTPNAGDKNLFCNIDGKKIAFGMLVSTGTQALQLLYFWMQKMGNATFVFIDEFDAFYHFKLSFEVCKRLFNLGCQVFLSSHNTYLMTNDLLRPDCNFIVSNGKIKPLNDCTDKELRFGHNIEKLFRGDAFRI